MGDDIDRGHTPEQLEIDWENAPQRISDQAEHEAAAGAVFGDRRWSRPRFGGHVHFSRA
jgi:hypothetical protein